MVYLLTSLEVKLLEDELNKIKNESAIEDINISRYDLESDSLKDVIDDALTLSMFSDKKMIICDNAYLFTSKKSDDTSYLEEYLENINPSTILIFLLNEEKLDERKKVTKLIKKNGIYKDLSIKDIPTYVKELFKGYNISVSDIKLFIDRVGTGLETLSSEASKIMLYKDSTKDITKEDIINLTSENIESDIFTLVDLIVNKDKENAIISYNKLLLQGEDPIAIISTLANKIRSIYQTKELYNLGYKENDIAVELGVKPGYLYYMKDTLRKYDSKTLLSILEKLIDLDYNIKISNREKENAFELFILEL